MVDMTAQAAFQSWLMGAALVIGSVLVLSFAVALVVVAFSFARQKDE
jgi:hypothetical protein